MASKMMPSTDTIQTAPGVPASAPVWLFPPYSGTAASAQKSTSLLSDEEHSRGRLYYYGKILLVSR